MIDQISALFSVAAKSLRYRLSGVILTTISVALSVFVLLGVEHVRQESRSSFASTVSGVDLIVGARTGDINLLLLSVFRIGSATANVSWDSVVEIERHPRVEWVVPLSLGDSHRGFRVVGTTGDFFDRYHFSRKQPLTFDEGGRFDLTAEVVLGASVANTLSYKMGDSLILSHGVAATSFTHHDQIPFTVVGLLAPTGTPVDNALFVSLEAINAMHTNEEGEHAEDVHDEHDEHDGHDEHVHAGPLGSVTALLVGLNGPFATLQVQRWVNEYEDEALLAVLPGVTLTQLWEMVGRIEDTLRGIAILVFVSSLFGLNAMLLASMRERRQEIDILRSVGAPSLFILGLLVVESLLIVLVGILLAIGGLLIAIAVTNGILMAEIGISFSYQILYTSSLIALGMIVLISVLLSLVPAWQAYRLSTSSGSSSSA